MKTLSFGTDDATTRFGFRTAGRLLPRMPRSIAGVVAACGKTPVLFDSGVRSGEHVIKALALGATAVAIGRPLICNDCGHMWEPPASLTNYFASYGKSAAIFLAGVLVTIITCAVVWSIFTRVDSDGEVALRFSMRRMIAILRGNYPVIAIVLFGFSLIGAGIWGVLRTMIVQMGWKAVLYDPDENKW